MSSYLARPHFVFVFIRFRKLILMDCFIMSALTHIFPSVNYQFIDVIPSCTQCLLMGSCPGPFELPYRFP